MGASSAYGGMPFAPLMNSGQVKSDAVYAEETGVQRESTHALKGVYWGEGGVRMGLYIYIYIDEVYGDR